MKASSSAFVGILGTSITAVLQLRGRHAYIATARAGRVPHLLVLGLANLMVWARLANRLGMALVDNPRIANTLTIVAMLLMMSAGFIFGGTITYLTANWKRPSTCRRGSA